MKTYSDPWLRAQIVYLTGNSRFDQDWSFARDLMAKQGVDSKLCLVLNCDQGGSLLMLPDGGLVVFDRLLAAKDDFKRKKNENCQNVSVQ